jgi:hypothetical protein
MGQPNQTNQIHQPNQPEREQPSAQSTTPTTPPRMRTLATLAVGDTAMFFIFAAVGRASHNEAAGFGSLLAIAGTAAPFIIGWFIAAPLVGAYRLPQRGQATAPSLPHFIQRSALAWLAAWPLGLLLRSLLLWRPAPLTFALITFITNLVLLGCWRSLFAWWQARRRI